MSLASKDTGITMSRSDFELTEKFPVRAAVKTGECVSKCGSSKVYSNL